METLYTSEQNALTLIALMKSHNICKVVASPGATNASFVASIQNDPFFELYSAVDERSAAYIACGLAAESGEPVVLSCTGATASRNYIPGLTEAFYRKLPVLAVTSTLHEGRIGQNLPQIIDRRVQLNDMVKLSVSIPTFHSEDDRWLYTVQINRALLELRRDGGGPVHINLTTTYSKDFSTKSLPEVKTIRRYTVGDTFPELPSERITVFVGDHRKWSDEFTQVVDDFCEKYDAVVLCDQTSNYRGKYRILVNLIAAQTQYDAPLLHTELMIDLGNVSGAYMPCRANQVWRVNPDGEVRDTYNKLRCVFQMQEEDFFCHYASKKSDKSENGFYTQLVTEQERIAQKIPELPFSNIWVAQHTAGRLPEHSILYLGILNTLRSWNFFETPSTVTCYSNTGGFGIDGGVSTLLGMSLADRQRLCFGVVGDLGFFYDMNALGNRHVGNNLRLMLINNGRGTEFRNYSHIAARFGEDADPFIAAAGHYGNQSSVLVKHYVEDLGCEYMSASNKEEYLACVERFLTPDLTDKPMVFEVFTDSRCESDALKIMNNLEVSAVSSAKQLAKNILGEKGVQAVKKILNK